MHTRNQVSLRPVMEDDLELFFDHQCDKQACQMVGFVSRARPEFMTHWAKILSDENTLNQTILVDAQVAGNLVSFLAGNERLVGYWLGRDYWGRGLATRALELFLSLEVRRPLHARVATHNVASIRVLEKCGFALIATESFTDASGRQGEEYLMRLR